MKAAAGLLALAFALPLAAQSNSIACLPTGQELVTLPEARSQNGILKATVATTAEQVRMTTGTFGSTSAVVCYPQWVRTYKLGAVPSQPAAQLADPMPGPVLRANVGDLVELTFLNQIDPNKFPNSDSGCDQTSTYPGQPGPGKNPDVDPDCFALSTTTNIHYHGTHTNPNTTGDNVFLEIRPSPRSNDPNRVPVVTPDTVGAPFAAFFSQCETQLSPNDAPKQWPLYWSDWPQVLRDYEQNLLQTYAPALWTADQNLISKGLWPQFYVGNYPYCFRLPKYTAAGWPPASAATESTAHTHGAGMGEMLEASQPQRPLLMGQAPGTHWYHAHKHGSTTINVMNGMTGIFVIQDLSPNGYDGFIANAYRPYAGIREQIMVVNQLGTTPSLVRGGGGGPGSHFSVNGRIQPKVTMRGGEVQLWRIADNSSRAGMFIVAPPANGLSWRQTAQDGVQLADSNYQKSLNQPILLAAGNRADLLVKAPMLAPGQKTATYQLLVMNTVDPSDRGAGAATEPLLTVVVNANGPDVPFMASAPPMPSYLADIADSEVQGTQRLEFASTPPGGTANPAQHTIDGKKFDGEVGISVRVNKVEEWTVVNKTFGPLISHPFHIHINPFQITELFDPNEAISVSAGTGTVTTTTGAATVAGTGTSFTRDVHPGDIIAINGERAATVVSVESDTALTMSSKARGKSAAAYTVTVPRYSIDRANARAGQCVLDPDNDATWKPCGSTPSKDRIWWDVFSIPSGKTFTLNGKTYNIPGHFKMRSRFVDYAGHYVLHCHILAHEDRGMMTVVEVSPLQSPYSHH